MLKVLIAEDEIGIYRLIKDLIEWDVFGLELVGYAKDGLEALTKIHQTLPDLVITDISMPRMNGLQLIEAVRQEQLPVRFVIISGYNHFDYAVTALKFGVEDYLLKPLSHDEINNVLEKLVNKIDTPVAALNNNAGFSHSLRHRTQLRASFLLQQTDPALDAPQLSLKKINEDYCFRFQSGMFQMGMGYLDHDEQVNVGLQSILLKQLIRIFENHLADYCYDLNTYEKNHHFVYLLNYDPVLSEEIFHKFAYILDESRQFLAAYRQISFTICTGSEVQQILDLTDSARESARILPARVLAGTYQILRPTDFPTCTEELERPWTTETFKLLKNSLEIHNMSLFHKHFQELLQKTADICQKARYLYLHYLEEMIFHLLSEIQKLNLIQQDLTLLYRQACSLIRQCSTPAQITDRLSRFFDGLFQSSEQEEHSHNQKLIQTARDYIENHYTQPLKLEDVADIVFLAPSYFGILFKKETGVTFSSYITNLRIEKAKTLLRDLRYNISEISEIIGYQNKRYFSRVFKECVGISPKEYRKIHHNKPY